MNHLIHPYLDSFSIHSFQNHILNSFEIAIDRHNAKLRFPRNYSLNLRYLLIALRSIFRRVFIEKPCVSYRTFGSGCLNASRIVVTNAASRLSFTYASRFDIRPDSRVRFHTRTIFCSQMDEIRLSENYWPDRWNYRFISLINFESIAVSYRSRPYPKIWRFVVVDLLQRKTSHQHLI